MLLGFFERKNAVNREFFFTFVPLKSIEPMQYSNKSFLGSIAPVTGHLLMINVILWLAAVVFLRMNIIDLNQLLGLHFWKASDFHIWQPFTYMFMHDTSGFTHIFFNMFSLWMFGSMLERVFGSKRYLLYYIVCGLGGALAQELVWQLSWGDILMSSVTGPAATSLDSIIEALNTGHGPFTLDEFYGSLLTVGASGAVFGILLAFGMVFPNLPLFLFFIPVPVKAKWVVIGYGLLELYFGISGNQPGVAHFAHLGGMVAGILLILYWRHTGVLRRTNGFY